VTEVKECGTRVLGAGDPTVFPVLAGMVYLDHAAVSPLPAAAAGAMRRYVDAWERFGSKSWGYDAPGRVRRLGAALIGAASEDEV
jgi:selenocysteine lyase/cysteine desulfurase